MWGYLKYQFKFWIFYAWTMFVCTVLIPFFFFRQKNPSNGKIVCFGMYLITNIVGVKWQLRNGKVLAEDRAAVVIANHQSAIDVLGMHNVWKEMSKCIVVSKRAMMYTLTCGLCMYWCDSIFIDRQNPKDAYKQLEDSAAEKFKNKTKIFIFPEGTRNRDLTNLLPFKKGAFAIAVASQVPIIPIVVSPYYFINRNQFFFNKGHVIIKCLEPISTAGLTMEDVPDLINRIHGIMDKTYKELFMEVKSTLPSNYPIALPDYPN